MKLKNFTFYGLGKERNGTLPYDGMPEFTPVTSFNRSSMGFVPVSAGLTMQLVSNGVCWICLRKDEKIIPAKSVKEAVQDRVSSIEAGGGRVSRKEKDAIRDQVEQTFSKNALVKRRLTYGFIDYRNDLVVIASASKAEVEDFINALRSIPESGHVLINAHPEKSPNAVMTDWILNKRAGIVVNNDAVLVCEDEKVTIKNVDIDGDEVKKLINSPMWVSRIRVLADDIGVEMVVSDDLVIRGYNPYRVTESLDEKNGESKEDHATRVSGELLEISSDIVRAIKWLSHEFGISL